MSAVITETSIAMNEANTYQYQPLRQPDAIRLIDLQPSPDLEAKVRCGIIHTTLRECDYDMMDHYTALSYVWGDPKETTRVEVDGCDFDVTVNLDSALRHMRDSTRSRRVWADAICINQMDNKEKGHQVAQMADVYKTAHHTVIYLGESTHDLDQWLRMLTHGDSTLKQKVREGSQALDELPEFELLAEYTSALVKRPWFTRVWILQELVFSKDPWIQIGQGRVRWDDILQHLKSVAHRDSLSLLVKMHASRKEYQAKVLGLQNSRFASRLLETLVERRGLGASDPRDMIFAHLALCADGEVEIPKALSADYTKTTKQVYEEAAAFIFQQTKNFDILAHAEETNLRSQKANLASWCPDWTAKSVARRIIQEDPPEYGPRLDLPVWYIAPSIIASCGSMTRPIRSITGVIESFPDGIRINGKVVNQGDRKGWFLERLRDDWHVFLDANISQHSYEAAEHISFSPLRILFNLFEDIEDWIEDKSTEALDGKRFAQLSEDEFLLVPRSSRPGDVVYLLGNRMDPFLLRPYEPDQAVALVHDRIESLREENTFPEEIELSKIRHFTVVGECSIPWREIESSPYLRRFILQPQHAVILH
ncbi:hypothetical protein EG329_007497 [Mollisiaceae sp. DMI_Dod_QoI]|nr:hypothetical protein EG329_007497 [Helotiales sp. DMI_Dod_QoI]